MNKLNKGKTIGIIAASLAAVALVGVGFSTWIINTTNTQGVEGISVTVAETKDLSVMISDAKVDETDNSVTFDADANKHNAVTNPFLSCGETDKEDLNFTITYKVTVGANAAKWEIKAGIDDTSSGANGKFTTAVTANKYIALPTGLGLITDSNGSKVCFSSANETDKDDITFTSAADTTDATKTVYTVTQKFTFSWGEAFAGKNPVEVTETDSIWTGSKSETATVANLTANTKGMKNLDLSTFKITLSVGDVSETAA